MLKKISITLALGCFCLLNFAQAEVPVLRKISSVDGRVQLQFDRRVDLKQVDTEFFKDIIQLNIRGASVYPAKIVSVENPQISKVFAYQYTPKLVRCRFTVKGKADVLKDHLKLSAESGTLIINLDSAVFKKDEIPIQAAQALRAGPTGDEKKEERSSSATLNSAPDVAVSPKINDSTNANSLFLSKMKDSHISLRPLWSLMGIVVLMVLCVIIVARRRKGSSRLGNIAGVFDFISQGKFRSTSTNFRIVSSYYLAPRKKLMVVELAGKTLVLGLSEQSIQLITELDDFGSSSEESQDISRKILENKPAAGARAAGPGTFSSVLSNESEQMDPGEGVSDYLMSSKTSLEEGGFPSDETSATTRERIRQRMKGMKVL